MIIFLQTVALIVAGVGVIILACFGEKARDERREARIIRAEWLAECEQAANEGRYCPECCSIYDTPSALRNNHRWDCSYNARKAKV